MSNTIDNTPAAEIYSWVIQSDSEHVSENSSVSSFTLDTPHMDHLMVDRRPYPSMMSSGLVNPMETVSEETSHASDGDTWSHMSGDETIEKDDSDQGIDTSACSEEDSFSKKLSTSQDMMVAQQETSYFQNWRTNETLSPMPGDRILSAKSTQKGTKAENGSRKQQWMKIMTVNNDPIRGQLVQEIGSNLAAKPPVHKEESWLPSSMSFRPSLERNKRSSPLSHEASTRHNTLNSLEHSELFHDLSLNEQQRSKTLTKPILFSNPFRPLSLSGRSKSAIITSSRQYPVSTGLSDEIQSRQNSTSTIIVREHVETVETPKPAKGLKHFFEKTRSFFNINSASISLGGRKRKETRLSVPFWQQRRRAYDAPSAQHSSRLEDNNCDESLYTYSSQSERYHGRTQIPHIAGYQDGRQSHGTAYDEDATLPRTSASSSVTSIRDFEPKPETLASLDRSRAQWKLVSVKSPSSASASEGFGSLKTTATVPYSEALRRSEAVLQECRMQEEQQQQQLQQSCEPLGLDEPDEMMRQTTSKQGFTAGTSAVINAVGPVQVQVSEELAKLYYDVCISGLGLDEIVWRVNDGAYK